LVLGMHTTHPMNDRVNGIMVVNIDNDLLNKRL